jgi:hypothetical protein
MLAKGLVKFLHILIEASQRIPFNGHVHYINRSSLAKKSPTRVNRLLLIFPSENVTYAGTTDDQAVQIT